MLFIMKHIFRSLFRLIIGRWRALPLWYNSRDRISSWKINWLAANSPTNYLIGRLFGTSLWKSSTIIRMDELKLSMPIDKLDEGPDWAFIGDQYLESLKKFFPSFTMQKGDVLIDVGAHVGIVSATFKHHFPGIKVFALEPCLANLKLLEENSNLNNYSPEDFKILPTSLYDSEGVISFKQGRTSTTGSLSQVGAYKEKNGQQTLLASGSISEVKCTTLDILFDTEEIEHCRLLKIDCEGCEYRAFQFVSREFWTRIDYMVVEAHPSIDGQPDELFNLLKEVGFEVETIDLGNGCEEFYCYRAQ